MEKLRNAAMAKIKAGRRGAGDGASRHHVLYKIGRQQQVPQTPLIVQASIRIAQAGSMDFMPS